MKKSGIVLFFVSVLLLTACSNKTQSSTHESSSSVDSSITTIESSSSIDYVSEIELESYHKNLEIIYNSLLEQHDYEQNNLTSLQNIYNDAILALVNSLTKAEAKLLFDTSVAELFSVEFIFLDEEEFALYKSEALSTLANQYIALTHLNYSEENKLVLAEIYEKYRLKIDSANKKSMVQIYLNSATTDFDSVLLKEEEAAILAEAIKKCIEDLDSYCKHKKETNYYSEENILVLDNLLITYKEKLENVLRSELLDTILNQAKSQLDKVPTMTEEEYQLKEQLRAEIKTSIAKIEQHTEQLLEDRVYSDHGAELKSALEQYRIKIQQCSSISEVKALTEEAVSVLDNITFETITPTEYALQCREALTKTYTKLKSKRQYYDTEIIDNYYNFYLQKLSGFFETTGDVLDLYNQAISKLDSLEYIVAYESVSAKDFGEGIFASSSFGIFSFEIKNNPITITKYKDVAYFNISGSKARSSNTIGFRADFAFSITISCVNTISQDSRSIQLHLADGTIVKSSTIEYLKVTKVSFDNLLSGTYYISCSDELQISDIELRMVNSGAAKDFKSNTFNKLMMLKDIFWDEEKQVLIEQTYQKYLQIAQNIESEADAIACYQEAKTEMESIASGIIGEQRVNS